MREIHNKEINGQTYSCQQLPATGAMVLLNGLAANLGPAAVPLLLKLVNHVTDKSEDGNEAETVLDALDVAGLLHQLRTCGDDYVLKTMTTLFAHVYQLDTTRDPPKRGKPLAQIFDETFSRRGGVKDALLVFAWALEINFQEYFGEGPSSNGDT